MTIRPALLFQTHVLLSPSWAAEHTQGPHDLARPPPTSFLLLPFPQPQTGLWPRLSQARLHVCTSLPWFRLFPARPFIWQVWPPDSIFLPLSLLSPTPVLLCCASRPCSQCFHGWWGVLNGPPYRGGTTYQRISGMQSDRSSGGTVQREVGRGLVRSCPRPAWGSRRGFWEVTLLK